MNVLDSWKYTGPASTVSAQQVAETALAVQLAMLDLGRRLEVMSWSSQA